MGLTDKLDILMKERNINKAELARESGVPYTTIDGFYKKGSENAKLSTLKKICAYFNCSLDYLADDNIDNERYVTIAAHKDGENFTADELEKIEEYKKLLIAARPKE
jgi:DNA-binding Xre family transcriptional regulator